MSTRDSEKNGSATAGKVERTGQNSPHPNRSSDFELSSPGVVVAHNNTRDFESFRNFQELLDSRYTKLQKQREKENIASSLKKWDSHLSSPWNNAKLQNIRDKKAAERAAAIIDSSGFCSMFIRGDGGSGKTMTALAVVRRFIGRGWVTPSQIVRTTEKELLAISTMGYRAQDALREILNSRIKLLVVEDLAAKKLSDGESALWGQVLEFASRENTKILFTSNHKVSDVSAKFSDSACAKFAYLIDGKIVVMSNVVAPPKIDVDDSTPLEESEDEVYVSDASVFANLNSGALPNKRKRR